MKSLILALGVTATMFALAGTAAADPHHGGYNHGGHYNHGGYYNHGYSQYGGGFYPGYAIRPTYVAPYYPVYGYPAYNYPPYGYPVPYGVQPGLSIGVGTPGIGFGLNIR